MKYVKHPARDRQNKFREPLINSSFRPERSGEPESSALNTGGYWIPACAGMTEE